jgi:hypothetical protein
MHSQRAVTLVRIQEPKSFQKQRPLGATETLGVGKTDQEGLGEIETSVRVAGRQSLLGFFVEPSFIGPHDNSPLIHVRQRAS